jgi:hypothetical protein
MRLAVVENCLKSTTTNPEAFRCLSERNTRLYQFAGFLLLRRRQFELRWSQSFSSGLQFNTCAGYLGYPFYNKAVNSNMNSYIAICPMEG